MRFDGKFLAVNGTPNFDVTFTAVTQHDGKFLVVDGFPFFDGNFLTVDGNSNFDGKSPLYRHRPPVWYFYVGKYTEHLPESNSTLFRQVYYNSITLCACVGLCGRVHLFVNTRISCSRFLLYMPVYYESRPCYAQSNS